MKFLVDVVRPWKHLFVKYRSNAVNTDLFSFRILILACNLLWLASLWKQYGRAHGVNVKIQYIWNKPATAMSYKQQHEQFVSNTKGTTALHIAVTGIACLLPVYLRDAIFVVLPADVRSKLDNAPWYVTSFSSGSQQEFIQIDHRISIQNHYVTFQKMIAYVST